MGEYDLRGGAVSQFGSCGEIDIMELLGHDVDTVYFTRHWGDPYERSGANYSGPDFSRDFHLSPKFFGSKRSRVRTPFPAIYSTSWELFQRKDAKTPRRKENPR